MEPALEGLGGALCSVTAASESGWIYSLIQENFGSLWEGKVFPLDLGESVGLAFPKLVPLAGGGFQGGFVGRGFRCAPAARARAGLGFSLWEFPAELVPFPNFPIQQNTSWKWGWSVNSQAGIP